jgi:DNA-binding NtrC family response regulator
MRNAIANPWRDSITADAALLEHVARKRSELDHAVNDSSHDAGAPDHRGGSWFAFSKGGAGGKLEDMSLEEVESFLIRQALARHDNNVSHASETLGLSEGIYRRMQRYGI